MPEGRAGGRQRGCIDHRQPERETRLIESSTNGRPFQRHSIDGSILYRVGTVMLLLSTLWVGLNVYCDSTTFRIVSE